MITFGIIKVPATARVHLPRTAPIPYRLVPVSIVRTSEPPSQVAYKISTTTNCSGGTGDSDCPAKFIHRGGAGITPAHPCQLVQ